MSSTTQSKKLCMLLLRPKITLTLLPEVSNTQMQITAAEIQLQHFPLTKKTQIPVNEYLIQISQSIIEF